MNLLQLKWYAVESSRKNPTLHNEIYDIVNLAISEIDEGGSENHECELARRDIEFIVNEKMIEGEMEQRNNSAPAEKSHGYSNDETYIMISHIHNDKQWLDDAFENIRRYNSDSMLEGMFKTLVFEDNASSLANALGKITFANINWEEIFENLKGMMPKETYEELEERLALANTQARILFDQLLELCNGEDDTMVEELSHAHNIKLLTDVSTNEWQYQD
jgi:hypothetical protein